MWNLPLYGRRFRLSKCRIGQDFDCISSPESMTVALVTTNGGNCPTNSRTSLRLSLISVKYLSLALLTLPSKTHINCMETESKVCLEALQT